jgi:hypothetical protein
MYSNFSTVRALVLAITIITVSIGFRAEAEIMELAVDAGKLTENTTQNEVAEVGQEEQLDLAKEEQLGFVEEEQFEWAQTEQPTFKEKTTSLRIKEILDSSPQSSTETRLYRRSFKPIVIVKLPNGDDEF